MEKSEFNNSLEINNEPTGDEIWDFCVRNFLYDKQRYVKELLSLFDRIGITKDSSIADISAGGGFPSIDLAKLGYKVDAFDGFSGDIFRINAERELADLECRKMLWAEIPELIPANSYEFVFCRGNSFIFASGGWDAKKDVDINKARNDYQKTMHVFASIIKPGGYLYIDKFKDSEEGHREKLATIKVAGVEQDLVFSSKRSNNIRQVYMDRIIEDKIVKRENRTTYDLSAEELISFMEVAGFDQISQLQLAEEKHFDVWLGKRNNN